MMDDVLSQDEVDNLLSAATDGTSKKRAATLQALFEQLGRDFGEALSALLRCNVEVKLGCVERLTFGQYLVRLANPTFLNVIRARPVESHLVLEVPPSILHPMIDRLLGGSGTGDAVTRRPLTELEQRLVSRITRVFLDEIQKTWPDAPDLELTMDRVESIPQRVAIVPPGEAVVLANFELAVDDVLGTTSLCIPQCAIDRLGDGLTGGDRANRLQDLDVPEYGAADRQPPSGSFVEVVARLAETQISSGDLLGLSVGDIITTDKDASGPIDILIEGQSKFRARPGTFRGRKAFRVEKRE